jgi:parvulin-like peptidyl-prolyl isomerase
MKYRTRTLAVAGGLGLVGFGLTGLGVGDAPQRAAEKRIAVVGERVVSWNDLGPMLAEAAGGQVLEEYALGMTLREECTKRGIKIAEADVRAERELLGRMLTKVAGVPENEAESLIRNSRRTRGLGDVRFRGLLERNAALRAMVREGVGVDPIFVTPEDIATAYELKYGERVRARLILVRSQAAATTARNEVKGGKPFAEVAALSSIDPSAERGGLLDPVSLMDSDYPVAVRTALGALKPGDVSEPIAVTWGNQTGFAVVQLVENVAAPANAPTKDAAANDLELEIRTVRERALMDKLGKMLVRNAGVSALEPSLNWSWEQRTK